MKIELLAMAVPPQHVETLAEHAAGEIREFSPVFTLIVFLAALGTAAFIFAAVARLSGWMRARPEVNALLMAFIIGPALFAASVGDGQLHPWVHGIVAFVTAGTAKWTGPWVVDVLRTVKAAVKRILRRR